jgi:hypothetical protein
MGITVHFEGHLRDEGAYGRTMAIALKFAECNGWTTRAISEDKVKLSRVRNETDWNYEGPTKGLELLPHPSSEPVRLEFDKNLYIQEYTKTQFAPPEIHKALVHLLDELAPLFVSLEVVDEGEYYESRNEDLLLQLRDECFEMLDELLYKDKTLRGPVRLPSGRIADLIDDP